MANVEFPTFPIPVQDVETLRARKAETLRALMKKKPGDKHYKRTLKAFLEADAEVEGATARWMSEAVEPPLKVADRAH